MQLSLFEDTVLRATSATGNTQGTYDYFAGKLGLSDAEMDRLTMAGKGGMVSAWKRRIRFIQQDLKNKGLIEKGDALGDWCVTGRGESMLNAAPLGSCRAYFVTKQGIAFCGDSATLSVLFKGEVDLIITSPPYLLINKKAYGSIGDNEKNYVDELMRHIESWLPMLTPTGSIVLNLGSSYLPGAGSQSLYRERLLIAANDLLGLKLVQKFTWWSPNKVPSGYYVTIAKKHCVSSTEDFYWLSLDPQKAKADNQSVLVEYSDKFKRMASSAMARKGAVSHKPGGQSSNDASFYALGKGAIPHDLLIDTPEGNRSDYSHYCKEQGLPRHPAMMPSQIPEFFVKFLTERGDFVVDPFLGSCKSALAAEKHGRFWAGTERIKEYLDGGAFRMRDYMVAR